MINKDMKKLQKIVNVPKSDSVQTSLIKSSQNIAAGTIWEIWMLMPR